jgi:hypothetical protein
MRSEPLLKAAEPLPHKRAELVEWSQRQLIKTSCAHCDASFEGAAAEAHAWFAKHRQTAHPELPSPAERRRRVGIATHQAPA